MAKRSTMVANEEQIRRATFLATDPTTDPVVIATALSMMLIQRDMLEDAYVVARVADRLIRGAHEDN